MFMGCEILGYEYMRYTCWLRDLQGSGSKSNSYSMNFSNFPASWEAYYDNQQLYMSDPVVRVLHEQSDDFHIAYGTWDDSLQWAREHPLGKDNKEKKAYIHSVENLFMEASTFNLQQGGYISHSNNVRHIMMSFATSKDSVNMPRNEEFWKTMFSLIMLCDQSIKETKACNDCIKSVRIDGEPSITLTKAQIRILTLFYEQRNATIKAIASKHGTTVDTINYHLRILREKLQKPGASGHALAAFAKDHNLF
jgi:DNA-binding CsgD family transcriptional regulator